MSNTNRIGVSTVTGAMRASVLAASAGLLLAACNGNDGDTRQFYADCMVLLNDSELQVELTRASTTPDAACTCVQAHLEDESDDREQVGYLMSKIADEMEKSGAGAEEAMGKIVSESMLPEDNDDAKAVADALPVFNETFESILDDMAENGGACPAV
jgi:hypothetical protein